MYLLEFRWEKLTKILFVYDKCENFIFRASTGEYFRFHLVRLVLLFLWFWLKKRCSGLSFSKKSIRQIIQPTLVAVTYIHMSKLIASNL